MNRNEVGHTKLRNQVLKAVIRITGHLDSVLVVIFQCLNVNDWPGTRSHILHLKTRLSVTLYPFSWYTPSLRYVVLSLPCCLCVSVG